jgi:hypothetical protein
VAPFRRNEGFTLRLATCVRRASGFGVRPPTSLQSTEPARAPRSARADENSSSSDGARLIARRIRMVSARRATIRAICAVGSDRGSARTHGNAASNGCSAVSPAVIRAAVMNAGSASMRTSGAGTATPTTSRRGVIGERAKRGDADDERGSERERGFV